MLGRLAVLGCIAVFAHAAVHVPTREIAAGVQMPIISIGIGGLETANASAIVSNWLKLGGRGIDTALVYKDQYIVPQELQKAGIDRKDVFITTKIPGCDFATTNIEYDLKQLKTDYIDLLLIHYPSGDCAKAWEVLEGYHAKGVLKAIGVSNFNKSALESLMKTAKAKPAVNQIELNVLEYDAEALAYAESLNITVEAYSPVGRSGHSGDISGNKVIQGVAANHNISTSQVALKWIVQHGRLLTFQSSSSAHQAADAAIFDFQLTEAEMKALDGLHGAPIYV